MSNNNEYASIESSKSELNPFSCLAVLLYMPAMMFSIRLGISTYWYIFAEAKGVNIILGILVTAIITIVYILVLVIGLINLLMYLGDKLWNLITKRKKDNKELEVTQVNDQPSVDK